MDANRAFLVKAHGGSFLLGFSQVQGPTKAPCTQKLRPEGRQRKLEAKTKPAFYRKHGATSTQMSCSDRMTFSLLSRPPQLSSARTPLRPSLRVKFWRRTATDAGVPIITLLRSASS